MTALMLAMQGVKTWLETMMIELIQLVAQMKLNLKVEIEIKRSVMEKVNLQKGSSPIDLYILYLN